jgi:hypothetical protein
MLIVCGVPDVSVPVSPADVVRSKLIVDSPFATT